MAAGAPQLVDRRSGRTGVTAQAAQLPAVKHHKRDVKCLTTKTILNFALLILSLILAYLDLALGFVSFRIRHHKNSFAAIL